MSRLASLLSPHHNIAKSVRVVVGAHQMEVVHSPQVEAGTHEEQVVHAARLGVVSRVAEDLDSGRIPPAIWF